MLMLFILPASSNTAAAASGYQVFQIPTFLTFLPDSF